MDRERVLGAAANGHVTPCTLGRPSIIDAAPFRYNTFPQPCQALTYLWLIITPLRLETSWRAGHPALLILLGNHDCN